MLLLPQNRHDPLPPPAPMSCDSHVTLYGEGEGLTTAALLEFNHALEGSVVRQGHSPVELDATTPLMQLHLHSFLLLLENLHTHTDPLLCSVPILLTHLIGLSIYCLGSSRTLADFQVCEVMIRNLKCQAVIISPVLCNVGSLFLTTDCLTAPAVLCNVFPLKLYVPNWKFMGSLFLTQTLPVSGGPSLPCCSAGPCRTPRTGSHSGHTGSGPPSHRHHGYHTEAASTITTISPSGGQEVF